MYNYYEEGDIIKKIELHLHLDGSLNVEYASKLCNRDVKNDLIASNCKDLKEYLEKFNLPISLLQSYDNIKEFSYLLAKDLVKDNVIYAEVRFCPLFHTSNLTVDEVITAIKEGFSLVKNIKVNLIFCMMRHFSFEDNLKIINLTKKYLGKGVCGIDLAGDEAHYKTILFKNLFDIINKENIPFTIHSGEADGKESIEQAIKFGARRIGHGVRCIEDKKIINDIIRNNIYLEICPTSNLDTKIYKSYSEHPIRKIFEKGVSITINTDNRTVSNTTLENEYDIIKKYFNFTNNDLVQFNLNAINASFLSESDKELLRKELLEEDNFK